MLKAGYYASTLYTVVAAIQVRPDGCRWPLCDTRALQGFLFQARYHCLPAAGGPTTHKSYLTTSVSERAVLVTAGPREGVELCPGMKEQLRRAAGGDAHAHDEELDHEA